jgi:hypothetical protein
MFSRHNAGNSNVPVDMVFEPSPVWHDDDAIAVDESAKNFLRNVLLKSKSQLIELRVDVDGKRREVQDSRRVRQAIKEGTDQRDEIEVVKSSFAVQESLHESERQKITAEVEISTITAAVGDVSIGARNHNFKSETFKIPTNCDHCGDRIWGLSAKGFSCRDCGFTCHSKCEMKIPADCPGELSKDEKKRIKLERQGSAHTSSGTLNGSSTDVSGNGNGLSRSDTMNTLSSGFSATAQRSVSGTSLAQGNEDHSRSISSAPRKHRVIAPPPTHAHDDGSHDALKPGEKRGKMIYSFQKNGEGEVSAEEGRDILILEPDGMLSNNNPTS